MRAMLVLAFDTSTLNGSVGWVKFSGLPSDRKVDSFARIFLPAKPGHAEVLLDRIKLVLGSGGFDLADVDLLVSGRGPGTFTGLRIGMSTAKAFSFYPGIPVVTVSTLEMTALSSELEGMVIPLIDARRSEVYIGGYEISRKGGEPEVRQILSDRVIKIENIKEHLESIKTELKREPFFCGDGVVAYGHVAKQYGRVFRGPGFGPDAFWMSVFGLAAFDRSGGENVDTISPVYLREPDAKLPKGRN
jgi:tRNA threonylcarbamoyladenosine biosynthesis protein TsaB